MVNATPEPPTNPVSRLTYMYTAETLTCDEGASFETSDVRECTVRSVHEDRNIALALLGNDMLLQPLREAAPNTDDLHQLPLARLFVLVDGFAHTCNRERVTFDGSDHRERKEEMLTGLPSHEIRPGPANVQRNLESAADGDADGVLGQELDMCGFLVRGVEVAEDEVTDVAAGPVLGPDCDAGPHVFGPTT